VINEIVPVSRKYGQLLLWYFPESKITPTTTDKDIFKYLSQIWFIWIWRTPL